MAVWDPCETLEVQCCSVAMFSGSDLSADEQLRPDMSWRKGEKPAEHATSCSPKGRAVQHGSDPKMTPRFRTRQDSLG